MCETAEASNMQQKCNASRFCLPIIYKIKNSTVLTLQLFSTFNDTTPEPRVYKKTQFTVLTKIKSFVVFQMNEGKLVVISSDEEDEVIITKKPKLEESLQYKKCSWRWTFYS